MAGRRPSGWTFVAAAAIFIAVAVAVSAAGRDAIKEAGSLRPPAIELPEPAPPAPSPDPLPSPTPGPT